MPRKKGIPEIQRVQLDRISEALARLSKEVKTVESSALLEDIAGDLEHVNEQLNTVTGVLEDAERYAKISPRPKPAPPITPAPPTPSAQPAAGIPPAPVRATATVAQTK